MPADRRRSTWRSRSGCRRWPPTCRHLPTRPHNARILGREVEVAYPFHPLFRRSAIVIGDQLHNGTRHLTLRSGEGPSFLVPAWMADPEAASVKIVDAPCLSIARLLDLRAFLDSGLACDLGEEIPEEGADGEAWHEHTAGSVRGAAAKHEARGDGAGEGAGAAPSASNGGGGDLGRPAGGRR